MYVYNVLYVVSITASEGEAIVRSRKNMAAADIVAVDFIDLY